MNNDETLLEQAVNTPEDTETNKAADENTSADSSKAEDTAKQSSQQAYTPPNPNQYNNQNFRPYYNQYPNQYYQQPAPQKPVRRVGTLTMGLSLIAAGAISIYSMINPGFDILMAAKFTPIILVFIGLEILINSFFYKNERLKYDFLSGFVCFILICTGVGAAASVPFIKYFGPERESVQRRLENEIYDELYNKLQGQSFIKNLNVSVHLEGMEYDKNMSINDIKHIDDVDVDIDFMKNYPSEKEFAADAKAVLNSISNIRIDAISFRSEQKGIRYTLYVDDRFIASKSVEDLTKLVDTYSEDGYSGNDSMEDTESSSAAAQPSSSAA